VTMSHELRYTISVYLSSCNKSMPNAEFPNFNDSTGKVSHNDLN